MRPVTFAFAILLVTSAAHAYQLKRDSTGEIVRWSEGAAHFVVDPRTAEVLREPRAFNAIQASVETVSNASAGLQLTVASGETFGVGYDPRPGAFNQNELVALEEWTFAESAVAVTVLTLDAKQHRILDADIAFNAQNRRFKVLSDEAGAGGDFHDIQNVLTHELGHSIGLDHNSERPDVVMYPKAKRGEVQKRRLSDDDQQGLEALYGFGASADPSGDPYFGAGCSATGSAPGGWWILGVMALLIGRGWRRHAGGAAAAIALWAAGAEAAEPVDPSSMVATADVVTARTVPPAPGARLLFTELELRVRECINGACGGTVYVRVPGGRFGDIEQVVEDHPVPAAGEVVAIIRRVPDGSLRPERQSTTLLRLAHPEQLVDFARALSGAGMRADLTFAVSPATSKSPGTLPP